MDSNFRAWIIADERMEYIINVNPWYVSDGDRCIWKHDEVKLLQRTGLRDVDNTASFYKDIVEYDGWLYVIEWDEENTGFYLADYRYLNDPDSEYHMQGGCIREGRVVGNIYKNSELLGQ